MPHDMQELSGIPSEIPSGSPAPGDPPIAGAAFAPLAQPLVTDTDEVAFTPDPEGIPTIPQLPGPHWPPVPLPRPCRINLRSGCYRLSFRPSNSLVRYEGTMRVDDHGGQTTISGDLYRFLRVVFPFKPWLLPLEEALESPVANIGGLRPRPLGIPIYARNRYHSYLKVTGIRRPPLLTYGPCRLTLSAEQYFFTQPPAGSFNGTFSTAPRNVEIVLAPKPPAPGYTSSYFEGTLYANGAALGTVAMGWVSSSFRKATLEIDTLAGAVAPQPVGGEDFGTVFGAAGWSLTVIRDQTNVPVPPGVNPTTCWSDGDLHALMTSVRNAATNLDAEWRMHMVVVPARMGCGRGVMYDTIGVPREGVASFSDDGYPTADSGNFGAAANQRQRSVPRAFLRSACHEVGHGFNQIHQEQEAGADNSIMTTTPSVADVLAGPTTGDPGVFPDQINLRFNEHVRHHLVHFPDPVVRPGGMTFGSGHSSTVPQADRYVFDPAQLELALQLGESDIALGEPLELGWTVTNRSADLIPVPSDVGIEAQHAFVTVTDPRARRKVVRSFVIHTDAVAIRPLGPGETLTAHTRVFWDSEGFAFQQPGKHTVEVSLVWNADGVPVGVTAATDVWVAYPQSMADNAVASMLLHPEVGKYVVLGGGDHLVEAKARIDRAHALASEHDGDAPRALRAYGGLAPTKRRTRPASKAKA